MKPIPLENRLRAIAAHWKMLALDLDSRAFTISAKQGPKAAHALVEQAAIWRRCAKELEGALDA